jgi:hypothetical protein
LEIEMLSKVIEEIQQSTFELIEDRRQRYVDLKAKVKDFIEQSDAEECQFVLSLLIAKVYEITGECSHLENALVELKEFIDDNGEDPICAQCNGSGEGQHDGTRCMSCKGKGTISRSEE